jgi:hypothetical protein
MEASILANLDPCVVREGRRAKPTASLHFGKGFFVEMRNSLIGFRSRLFVLRVVP